jgi:hypothetical protein
VISLQVHPRILPDYLGPYNFDYVVRRYETQLKSTQKEKKMERVQYCLYRGIDLFFDMLIIAGPEGKQAAIQTKGYHDLKRSRPNENR